ncbi:MAG: hypothetical protein H0U83_03160 [Sphingomonas sp.]|nr:hypothetical protein [Sphingomonas sp.]
MNKKIIAAVLLAASIPAPAQAKNVPARTWWCAPSGMTNLTPLFRLITWTCEDSRPMDR